MGDFKEHGMSTSNSEHDRITVSGTHRKHYQEVSPRCSVSGRARARREIPHALLPKVCSFLTRVSVTAVSSSLNLLPNRERERESALALGFPVLEFSFKRKKWRID